MPDTAVTQAPRIVELVAWLSQSDRASAIGYRAAARHLGVSEQQIREDLDVLLELSAEHKDWLASLRVGIVADGLAVHSSGAFRRPMHFSGEEGLALLIGLAAVRGGKAVAAKFAKALRRTPPAEAVESSFAIGAAPSDELEGVLAVCRRARDEKRKLDVLYCGSAGEPSRRVVHVHQLVESFGRWYVYAWCESVQEMRRFRADRILEATLLARDFRPQLTFTPIRAGAELLRADGVVRARVAFSKRIARWLKERYPGGREQQDEGGRYVVTFQVADPAWFVREVLYYGAEAEVLEPEGLREAVRRVVQ
jgi:predicted DNA-binding transcriptional regulator YafY